MYTPGRAHTQSRKKETVWMDRPTGRLINASGGGGKRRETHTVGKVFSGGLRFYLGLAENDKKSAVLTQQPTTHSIEIERALFVLY